MKYRLFAILLTGTLLAAAPGAGAQQLHLGLNAGAARLVGQDFERWTWGFTLGGDLLFSMTDNILLGGRFAYNRWSPNDGKFLALFDSLTNGKVKGNTTIYEILPTVRLTSGVAMSPINLFVQGSAGLYVVKNIVDVTGIVPDGALSRTFGKDTNTRFGLAIGAGATLGSPEYFSVELFPTYNMIFLKNDMLKYLNINLGLSFGI